MADVPGRAGRRTDWAARFARPLPRDFFARPTRRVARELLGAVLLSRRGRGWAAARLVETEAYVAGDPASHAFRGPTERNRSMFAGPGTLYVYRIHQVYCANVATLRGEAVLLRAAEPLTPLPHPPRGPGRLCRAFGLDRSHDGGDVRTGPVRLVRGTAPVGAIAAGPRVGIRRALAWPLRYAEIASRWVSPPRPTGPAPRRASGASPRSSRAGARSSRTRTRRRRPSGGGRSGGRTVGR